MVQLGTLILTDGPGNHLYATTQRSEIEKELEAEMEAEMESDEEVTSSILNSHPPITPCP